MMAFEGRMLAAIPSNHVATFLPELSRMAWMPWAPAVTSVPRGQPAICAASCWVYPSRYCNQTTLPDRFKDLVSVMK
jgi:hypothetical protein